MNRDPGLAASFDDPLLECLAVLTRLNGNPKSPAALIAGLPQHGGVLGVSGFLRACELQGYAARIVKRSLSRIPRLVLPAVLLLKDERACVLTRLDSKARTAEIILPETPHQAHQIPWHELDTDYAGHVLFVQSRDGSAPVTDDDGIVQPRAWFWGTLWRFKGYYAETLVAALLINVLTLATSFFSMNVYDRVVPNNAIETLWVLATGTGLAIGFEFVSRMLRGYLLDIAGKKADLLLASALFRQALGLKLAARPASAGAFASVLREFESVRDFFTSATLTGFTDLPFVALFLVVIYLVGGSLVWVPLIAIPIVVGAGLLAQWPLSSIMRSHLTESSQRHGVLIESVEGLETIKALDAQGHMQGRWETYTGLTARSATQSRLISSLVTNLALLTQQLVTVGTVVWGVYLIAEGHLTTGGLIACVILCGRALAPLGQVAGLIVRYQQARSALSALNRIMKLPIERPLDRSFLHRPRLDGALLFDKVSFAYAPKTPAVLIDLSLNVKAGERIGILGRIGSGKSTLLRLSAGLYTPSKGTIMADGVDLQQIDPADLRRNMGYVNQETRLFAGTLRSNLLLGAPMASDDDLVAACRVTGIDRWVASHPQGFDLSVGERGDNLSGGQKQAVAIARALLRAPRLLLMDEPTSSMDHNTEQTFINNLRAYLPERTLLLATHKPALLELVDRLIVLEQGQIVVDGPRDQVLDALTRGIPAAT